MTGIIICHSDIFGDIGDIVFHYTSPNTFLKIISNQELWFSRCDCLNDYEDGEVLGILYPDCLCELYASGAISQEYYNVVSHIDIHHSAFRIEHRVPVPSGDPSVMIEHASGRKVECTPFVCCFSQEEDSLQMWQYYSKVGNYEGYNIGFALKEMLQVDSAFLRIGKVLYGSSEQKEKIKHIISTNYEVFCTNLKENGGIITNRKDYLRQCADDLSSSLGELACFFKRDCFSGEREIRIVLEVPKNPEYRDALWMKNIGEKEHVQVQYRIQHSMMIPYVVVKFDPNSIKRIMIGPVTSSKDNSMSKNKEVIDEFIYDRLKRHVPISTSIIPVRY